MDVLLAPLYRETERVSAATPPSRVTLESAACLHGPPVLCDAAQGLAGEHAATASHRCLPLVPSSRRNPALVCSMLLIWVSQAVAAGGGAVRPAQLAPSELAAVHRWCGSVCSPSASGSAKPSCDIIGPEVIWKGIWEWGCVGVTQECGSPGCCGGEAEPRPVPYDRSQVFFFFWIEK